MPEHLPQTRVLILYKIKAYKYKISCPGYIEINNWQLGIAPIQKVNCQLSYNRLLNAYNYTSKH